MTFISNCNGINIIFRKDDIFSTKWKDATLENEDMRITKNGESIKCIEWTLNFPKQLSTDESKIDLPEWNANMSCNIRLWSVRMEAIELHVVCPLQKVIN